MVHISHKLAESSRAGKPAFSFEYFPPKTGQGVQNLYDRIDRMHDFGPEFIDITWGAGGSRSDLTLEMINVAQSVYGCETCMHLTCTNMPKEKLDNALKSAYESGCQNILALRGDPPTELEKWEAHPEGFRYAKDLVKYIREQYGDYFDIAVAAYPEGCDDERDVDLLLDHLKEKVDAGATFAVTQMFYDIDIFLDWAKRARAKGINIPIIPGIMPIHTYAAFMRRAEWSRIHIPEAWLKQLDPVKSDDVAVRDIGRDLVAELCQKLIDNGFLQLHFYTMNLATATRMVLEKLRLLETTPRPLPFRPSLGFKRKTENVRPIFWKHRKSSYIRRTQDWDDFPNGRWGDSRSPAFLEVDLGLRGTKESNIKVYGRPTSLKDISDIFIKFLNGKLNMLPWSESAVTNETDAIKNELIQLNSRGFLTINSQPAVSGVKSSHPVYGWGPKNGYVYQKAYLELLVPSNKVDEILRRIEALPEMTYYAVNKAGTLKTNCTDGPNAVTWGVYPGKEIIQPTIVELISFLAWKDEAYRVGDDWAKCYEPGTAPRQLIEDITNNWWLINIVDNDFHRTSEIFRLFDGLEVEQFNKAIDLPASIAQEEKPAAKINGHTTAA